jgi:hypothetical protein
MKTMRVKNNFKIYKFLIDGKYVITTDIKYMCNLYNLNYERVTLGTELNCKKIDVRLETLGNEFG